MDTADKPTKESVLEPSNKATETTEAKPVICNDVSDEPEEMNDEDMKSPVGEPKPMY
ncbi:hypothetical protein H4R18_003789 [Coemansia javaensis]|uniref:Uncharacterized protein n=1 Tax=Coemansia javaensis TaxID=2761396 RepID=A0A9W8LGR6_9FUNG|nr:hypothetical protein H4R18_003789 [Coemansia javaensis]